MARMQAVRPRKSWGVELLTLWRSSVENFPPLWISPVKPRKMGAFGSRKAAQWDSPQSAYPHPTICAQCYPQMWIYVCILRPGGFFVLVGPGFPAGANAFAQGIT